ncbi:MAG: hypothetical protein A2W31_04265 [Planctomycetes bacterium RBG_16_64_10]|nr:MAG: hypothetical protein A2W31_04265 [Planctomycetes bacterium RBG_16_64_10]
MGRLLLEQQLRLDLIVSSTAQRAQATATLVSAAAGYQGAVLLESNLYHGGIADILNVIRQLNNEYRSALVIGHNPGMVNLLEHLTGGAQDLPTAAVAQLQLCVERWSDVDWSTSAMLMDLWRPRELP